MKFGLLLIDTAIGGHVLNRIKIHFWGRPAYRILISCLGYIAHLAYRLRNSDCDSHWYLGVWLVSYGFARWWLSCFMAKISYKLTLEFYLAIHRSNDSRILHKEVETSRTRKADTFAHRIGISFREVTCTTSSSLATSTSKRNNLVICLFLHYLTPNP